MAKNRLRTVTSKIAAWHIWIQTGFLVAWLDPFKIRMHTVCSPVFHCYSCPLATFACPIGVLANYSALHVIPFAAIGILFFVGAAFGSFVCGWACPFGFLQDLLAKIPLPKWTPPTWLSWFRYVVLIGLVLAVPFFLGEDSSWFFCRLCPAGALEGAVPNVIQAAAAGNPIPWPSVLKWSILGTFLVASLIIWRPWCTIFCPLGAIYTLFDPVSLFFLRFHPKKCHDCSSCRSLCQDGGHPELRADSLRCVRCLECTDCDAVSIGTVFTEDKTPLITLSQPKEQE